MSSPKGFQKLREITVCHTLCILDSTKRLKLTLCLIWDTLLGWKMHGKLSCKKKFTKILKFYFFFNFFLRRRIFVFVLFIFCIQNVCNVFFIFLQTQKIKYIKENCEHKKLIHIIKKGFKFNQYICSKNRNLFVEFWCRRKYSDSFTWWLI